MLEVKFLNGRWALVEVEEIFLNDENNNYTGEVEWRETVIEYGKLKELNEKVEQSHIIEYW